MRVSSSTAAAGSETGSEANAWNRSGLLGDRRRQAVVELTAPHDRLRRLQILHEVAERGEHLHVDARGIHHAQATLAEVVELGRALAGAQPQVDARCFDDVAGKHVLFDGDDLHPTSLNRGQ